MEHTITAANVDTHATRMTEILRERGIDIKKADVIEALAGAMDYRTSNALKAESNKPFNKLENAMEKAGIPPLFKKENPEPLPPSETYETTFRFKFLPMMLESKEGKTTIDDVISITSSTLKMLLEWKRLGVKYDAGASDDYATFSTTNKYVAERFGFHTDTKLGEVISLRTLELLYVARYKEGADTLKKLSEMYKSTTVFNADLEAFDDASDKEVLAELATLMEKFGEEADPSQVATRLD